MDNNLQTPEASRYRRWSLGLFGLAVILFFLSSVVFDSMLASFPNNLQRLIIVLTIILPNAAGLVFGILEFRQPNRKTSLAITGILLNGLMGAFFIFLINFAG